MLSGPFTESTTGEITFPDISTRILEKTIQYCHYKLKYGGEGRKDNCFIPEFVIEPEIALELLMSSNYLDL